MDVEAEVLFKKGKRFAAAYLQVECAKSTNPPLLKELLDILLDPKKSIDSWDTIDWCRYLMAGGKTPDEYGQTVRRYDNATTCGLVWTANFVAYRCRTCGISPCMSLCSECFLQGNHEGHDFNMFRSQAGGACDCGDSNVMKENGFCLKHGPKAQINKPQVPPDLLCVAEAMMPRIFLRLIQHLREHSRLVQDFSAIQEADGFIAMLHQYSELGGAMRAVLTLALNNPNVYHELAVDCYDANDPEKTTILKRNYELYLLAKERLSGYEVPDELLFIKAIQPDLKHNTFLEELVFWTVKFEFPQKLVCFLLNMLPDQNYKIAFTQTFVNHYSRISVMLANSGSSDTLSNRVVHVSVQLFSNEDLTLKMTKEYHLLYTMIVSIKAMMDKIILQNTLQDVERNFHFVVDCSHPIMKDHCYWPVVSDLNNVLTHRPVAFEFLKDSKLLDMWFSFLMLFQGMNVNQRELRQHVEFEPNTYYAAFLAELEASSTPMWALIAHLKDIETTHLTKQVIQRCLLSLIEWFDAIGMSNGDTPNPYQVSFHLPLHRYLSVFLCQAIVHQGIPASEVVPGPETLKSVMLHPLQAQVAFHEILSGMWVRNGLQIKGQAMTYIQCHFCNSTVDADLFLLQLCASYLDSDWFVQTVLERFQVWEWFSFKEPNKLNYLSQEQVLPMLEGALTFLATLVDVQTNMGMSEEEITRQEMISLLCMNDRTHSQLMELLPEKCGTTSQNKDFESILSQIADYKAPNFEAGGNMVQGIYVPKAEIWEKEYDPIHVLLRAVQRRDFQASVDRYTQYLRQSGKYHGTGSPWLPFRIPQNVHCEIKDPRRILQSQTLHGIIFTILYRACSNPLITEQIISLSVYLLELSLRFPPNSVAGGNSEKDSMCMAPLECFDLNFKSWFPDNNTLQNMCHPIHNVVVSQGPSTSLSTRSSVDCLYLSGSLGNIALLGSAARQGDTSPVESIATSSYDGTIGNMVEEMEIDEEMIQMNNELMDHITSVYEVQSPVTDDFGVVSLQNAGSSTAPLLPSNHQLALPSSSEMSSEQALVLSSPRLHIPQASTEGDSNETALVRSQGESTSSPESPDTEQAPDSTDKNQSLVLSRRLVAPTRHLSLRRHTLPNKCDPSDKWALPPLKALPNCSHLPKVEIHETFFTLLMRLHSKFSSRPDSYQPPIIGPKPISSEEMEDVSNVDTTLDETRMGDGTFFVRQLLDRVIRLFGSQNVGEQLVKSARQRIWPNLVTKNPSNSPNSNKIPAMDKEERRRKAKERQMKLMAEFASRQKAFMEQSMKMDPESASDGGMDDGTEANAGENPEAEADFSQEEAKEYECIICGQTTPSTFEKTIGMVVLIQATSILGHSHQLEADKRRLPCNDEEMREFKKEGRLGVYMEKRVQQMFEFFDNSSWQLAVNIGWDGGVQVQSCGHYLHMDCHKSYIQSLRSQSHQTQRQQNLAVESGEYFCPLCRQLANSILPLNPEVSERKQSMALIRSHPNRELHELANELGVFFSSTPVPVPSILKKMGNIMEDLTVATYPQYRSFCNPDSHGLHLFVCSIARTNLEIELLQRRRTLSTTSTTKSCFVPLFQVLACHAKVLARAQFVQWWLQLSGLAPKDQFSSLTPVISEVPIFLRDVSALLIQFILSLRSTVHKAYYTCVVQILFNVAYAQALAQLSCNLTLKQRLKWKARATACDVTSDKCDDSEQSEATENSDNSTRLSSFGSLFGTVIDYLEHCNLYVDDDELDVELRNREWLESEMESDLELLCMPFLRIAALLQSHLYNEELPQIQNESFNALCKYLGLGKKNGASMPSTPTGTVEPNSTGYLRWAVAEPLSLINSWCQNMISFVNKSNTAARSFLVERPLKWHTPILLRLPHNYNQIFQYYHRMLCVVCHGVPKDPSLCLICGTLICLREICCRQQVLSEAVAHSISCGAGTAMFLTVNSSTIVVIRGKRACLWGSVYLDKFGEEDRDLKRGKPLYLSQDRYRLLENQWLSHSFDHTNKRWVWHRDNL